MGSVTSRLSWKRSPRKKRMVSQIESKWIKSETGAKGSTISHWVPYSLFFFLFLFFFCFVRKLAGSCIDAFSYNVGAPFSTKDKDADSNAISNCAVDHQGAWWYKNCAYCNLNGKYNPLAGQAITGIYWYHNNGHQNNGPDRLKWVEIKMQPFG